jgi:hypothetical protein
MGAMTSMMAPSCGSRGWAGGTLDWWPKARPRCAVLGREPETQKADEPMAAPKGHGPLDSAAFYLQIGIFLGTTTGPRCGDLGPL